MFTAKMLSGSAATKIAGKNDQPSFRLLSICRKEVDPDHCKLYIFEEPNALLLSTAKIRFGKPRIFHIFEKI